MNHLKPDLPVSTASYFLATVRQGFIYALWFIFISMLAGALYGIWAGILIQPGIYLLIYTGLMAIINFLIALIIAIPNSFLLMLGKGSRGLVRYFGWSLAFATLYFAFFCLMHFLNWKPF